MPSLVWCLGRRPRDKFKVKQGHLSVVVDGHDSLPESSLEGTAAAFDELEEFHVFCPRDVIFLHVTRVVVQIS